MRSISSLLATVFFCISPVFSMGDEHHHEAASTISQPTIHASGTVKMIADNHQSIRIFHDPIPALKWPSMNMPFGVEDDTLIHTLKPGDNVEFEFVQQGSKNTIVRIMKR